MSLSEYSFLEKISIYLQCDQQKQGIAATPEKMNEYVKEHGFAGWFETSAKENVHIEEAARALVNKVTNELFSNIISLLNKLTTNFRYYLTTS